MALYDNGILMTNGFSIGAAKPADLKYIAETIDERNSLVTKNISYEGMLVYVKATGKTYQLLSNGTWDEFGFNHDKFVASLYNGLDSTSTVLALTANQGKVLNDKLTTHANNTTVHITADERKSWNAKASTDTATINTDGLMSKEDKSKLNGISSGANNYVHPDTHPATMITENSTHRFVTDQEKKDWYSKASTDTATINTDGLMSKDDKAKLDSIASNANNYTHPDTHPATMITENSTHRFVTDEQITTWNAKASASLATQTANGLMSASDKKKLDSIASNANNYTHPDTHPATMITADATHRFVTDEQINYWNSKPGSASDLPTATTSSNGLMSKDDKSKLDSIEAKANYYVHPSNHPATMITENSTHRFVTDDQITTWNAKASTSVASTSENGLMSSGDKSKLDSIDSNANNYTHPSSHAATMITQDATHRFITDTERTTWNAKASTDTATINTDGLMSAEDKKKLDDIEDNANKYVHPDTHPATMITENSTHRFITDTERTTWNAKASTDTATINTNGLMSKEDKVSLNTAVSDINTMKTQIKELQTNYEVLLAKVKTGLFF